MISAQVGSAYNPGRHPPWELLEFVVCSVIYPSRLTETPLRDAPSRLDGFAFSFNHVVHRLFRFAEKHTEERLLRIHLDEAAENAAGVHDRTIHNNISRRQSRLC